MEQMTAPEVPEATPPTVDQAMMNMALEQFRSEQNLVGGILAGLAAAIAGAAVWAVVTVVSGYQIGWMAVGVGFIVGFAVRYVGKGLDRAYGFIGACLALLGCLIGNALTIVYFVAESANLGYFECLMRIKLAVLPELMVETFSPMDILFYAIAVYEGYKFSFRRIGPEEIERAVKGGSAGITQTIPSP